MGDEVGLCSGCFEKKCHAICSEQYHGASGSGGKPFLTGAVAEEHPKESIQSLWLELWNTRRHYDSLVLLWICLFACIPEPDDIKKHIQKKWLLLYLIIGMVPFLRFVVISEHSAVHAWFTYRALAASVMAFILLFYELVDFNFKRKYVGR